MPFSLPLMESFCGMLGARGTHHPNSSPDLSDLCDSRQVTNSPGSCSSHSHNGSLDWVNSGFSFMFYTSVTG